MTRRRITVARTMILSLLGVSAMALAGEALAQSTSKPYGCACLHNTKVEGKINYRYKWGDKDWKVSSLQKGTSQTMCWAYKDGPKSPELQFQLDSDMSSGKKWETFSVPRGQSSDVKCGSVPDMAHYHVGYVKDSNKKKIMVYNGKS
jgi:hypothetical protein